MMRAVLVAVVSVLLLAPPGAAAQNTVAAVPGADYGAGWLHRLMFGSSYRQLWVASVTTAVLDLDMFAGGLTPTGTGGGKQTLALRFKGADGRPYTFRALNKNPAETLPPELRDSYVSSLYQDQISSSLPTGHLVVPAFLEALDILHAAPRLVVLPDSPQLGEWRERFAGQMGMIEEWPNEGPDNTPGFAGATDVISTDELWVRARASSRERIAVEEYLSIRLIDQLVGDWDRHRGQLRWANLGPGSMPAWRPIPEDRDQAFARYDGLILGLAREAAPQLVVFGDGFSPVLGATWNGRDVDRSLLVGVSRASWDSVTTAVQAVLTDELIAQAVARLPREHYDLVGATLEQGLQRRRDALPQLADRFYRHLATEVDVRGTDDSEIYTLVRGDDAVELSVRAVDADSPWLQRRLYDGETNDVRLFLGQGDDQVILEGDGDSDVFVHVVSDFGANRVEDRSDQGGVRVYDDRPVAERATVSGVDVDSRAYEPPALEEGVVPPRDWGGRAMFRLGLGFTSDLGALVGGTWFHRKFGFRKKPHAREIRLGLMVAPREESARGEAQIRWHGTNSRSHTTVRAFASGIEVIRYFGLGNETTPAEDTRFNKVRQTQLLFEPFVTAAPGDHVEIELGAAVRYAATEDDLDRLIGQEQPYGYEDFGHFRVRADAVWDRRNRKLFATEGFRLSAGGAYTPQAWSVKEQFGSVEAEAATFLTAADRVTLALRAGGKQVWGMYPFHEAAYLGGLDNLRGYQQNRFAGDAALFGNAEIRLALGKFFLLLPNHFGLVALADVGRVFLEEETSSKWHPGYGVGFWVAPLQRNNAAILGIAQGEDDTRFYFRMGFGY